MERPRARAGAGVLTVTQLNHYLKSVIESDFRLREVFLRGEISNCSPHYKTGHLYFTLKDEQTSVRCVMFRTYRERLFFEPEDGMSVILRGQVTVYERDGLYQIMAYELQPEGIGALHLAFEQLKSKLAAEGLFDQERKKQLPIFPKMIGLITSPAGAVLQDLCNVIGRRYPVVRLRLYPVSVQGREAEGQIVAALEQANREGCCDLLVLARGGGSLEDLWAFNLEPVARAIAASRLPVVSAVGHETDYTISDFAADLRAPTPSAAGELVTPDGSALLEAFGMAREQCGILLREMFARNEADFAAVQEQLVFQKEELIAQRQSAWEQADRRLKEGAEGMLEKKRQALRQKVEQLELLSPMRVLLRGYSLTEMEDGSPVCWNKIAVGDRIATRMAEGTLVSQVCGICPREEVE